MTDIRQVALEHITLDEAALREHVESLEADVAIWRAFAIEAIHVVHERSQELEALRRSHHRVIDEYRRLRVQVLTGRSNHEAAA